MLASFAGLSTRLPFGNAANGFNAAPVSPPVLERPLADGPYWECLRQIFSPRDGDIGARQDDAGNEPRRGIRQL
jgi:hypothetical protein